MRSAAFNVLLLVCWLAVLCPATTTAAGDCCAHCGCRDGCQKVCRLVCEEKTIEITCWGYKCEDFCVPGPSCPQCKFREEVCGECDADAQKAGVTPMRKTFAWWSWDPNPCGTIYTKKKLMKKIVKKKVPSYKWVVEDLCPPCEAKAPVAHAPAGGKLPQVPVSDAKIKVGSQLLADDTAEYPTNVAAEPSILQGTLRQ
ncbi:MAG: hypothetical protein KF708_13770 [Pirellulales bacterium]|nr:hypothetical protein [Pirellulales bacterium]